MKHSNGFGMDGSLIIGPLWPSTGDVRQAKADGTGQALALTLVVLVNVAEALQQIAQSLYSKS